MTDNPNGYEPDEPVIDYDAIASNVATMSTEEIYKSLLKHNTSQKKGQLRHNRRAKAQAKATAEQRRVATRKAMIEAFKQRGGNLSQLRREAKAEAIQQLAIEDSQALSQAQEPTTVTYREGDE